MDWFNAKIGQLTFEQERERELEYFTTFYGNEPARRIWADIRRSVLAISVTTPEGAIAKLANLDLIESIKESCGITDQLAIVDAELQAAVSSGSDTEPPKKEDLLEV